MPHSWGIYAGNTYPISKNIKSGVDLNIKIKAQQAYNMDVLVSFVMLFIYTADKCITLG